MAVLFLGLAYYANATAFTISVMRYRQPLPPLNPPSGRLSNDALKENEIAVVRLGRSCPGVYLDAAVCLV